MRSSLAVAVAAALGLAAGLFVGRQTAEAPLQPPVAPPVPSVPLRVPTDVVRQPVPPEPKPVALEVAPPPRAKAGRAWVKVPLDATYAVTPWRGTIEIPKTDNKSLALSFVELQDRFKTTSISTAFMVAVLDKHTAPPIHQAMHQTHRIFQGERLSEVLYLRYGPRLETPWVFVLIKTEIDDRELDLAGVEVDGHRVFVNLEYGESFPFSGFRHRFTATYAFWAPLPKSESDEPYILTVSDNLHDEPLLVHRVRVKR